MLCFFIGLCVVVGMVVLLSWLWSGWFGGIYSVDRSCRFVGFVCWYWCLGVVRLFVYDWVGVGWYFGCVVWVWWRVFWYVFGLGWWSFGLCCCCWLVFRFWWLVGIGCGFVGKVWWCLFYWENCGLCGWNVFIGWLMLCCWCWCVCECVCWIFLFERF